MAIPHKKHQITINGAKTHNLKNIDLALPHHKLIVITGRSGSGKSSLAFDTIFREGQLIFLESLNAYARQFLGKIERPPVESIQGLLPSIGMQQKSKINNPRARVVTTSDLYSYLKILYTRLGITYSPVSGQPVKKHTVTDVVDYILSQKQQSKIHILAPLHPPQDQRWHKTLQIELSKGFTRLICDGKTHFIEQLLEEKPLDTQEPIYLLVDRIILKKDDPHLPGRLADSIQTAFFEGQGQCLIQNLDTPAQPPKTFSDRFEADGITFEVPTLQLFSFNNSYGACPTCRGWGKYPDIDPNKVIPNPYLSLKQGAIHPWQSIPMRQWKDNLLQYARKHHIPTDIPYEQLTPAQQKIIWQGDSPRHFEGIQQFFDDVATKIHKVSYRIIQSRYRNFLPCDKCHATGLRPEVHHIKINHKSLIDLLNMTLDELAHFFQNLTLPPHQEKIGHVLLEAIQKKLHYLQQVGLGYLVPKRRTQTLSGGEYQRLCLGKLLGSPLVDALYVLDEPTIGLHPRDTDKLVKVLTDLQQLGNTVIVVEHEEALMRAAHHIVDIGPKAGQQGGQVVFQGSWKQLTQSPTSETAQYLTGEKTIPIPPQRRQATHHITLEKINLHNLDNLTATFPLNTLTLITGVSGSGKSTLIEQVLYPALCHHFHITTPQEKHYQKLTGDLSHIEWVEYFGQGALGRSSRSNIATYLKVYDHIRLLYASQPLAQERNYAPHLFSLNIEGGRCENCLGEGHVTIDMHFMADVGIPCEECHGHKFKPHILDITYQDKNIAQVLDMTVDEALHFFQDHPPIIQKLQAAQQVGLGYLPIGQPSSYFSGGEAQRLKISPYLIKKRKQPPTLFIFDEPTTGLHFHDIQQLLTSFQQLVAQGHTVIIIEHNIEIIKCADWIIDLGPEAGTAGGHITFAGTPEQLAQQKNNHTARYLKPKLL